MQLSLSLLEFGFECLLSYLETADFNIEVLLLLVERHYLGLFDGSSVPDGLYELWNLILRVLGYQERALSLLRFVLISLSLDKVYELLLR